MGHLSMWMVPLHALGVKDEGIVSEEGGGIRSSWSPVLRAHTFHGEVLRISRGKTMHLIRGQGEGSQSNVCPQENDPATELAKPVAVWWLNFTSSNGQRWHFTVSCYSEVLSSERIYVVLSCFVQLTKTASAERWVAMVFLCHFFSRLQRTTYLGVDWLWLSFRCEEQEKPRP